MVGARECAIQIWSAREGLAIYAALTGAWCALAAAAAWASSATGLGASWGEARQIVSWAGAATQIFLGLAIPLLAAADEVDAHSGYREGFPGRPGASGEEMGIACVAGFLVAALDLGRFAGPWAQSFAPEWLSAGAAWWWTAADTCSAAVGAALWISVGAGALAEIARAAWTVSEARWLQIERDEIARVSKPAKRRDSGPRRL